MTKDQARFLLSAAFPVLIGTCRTATCPTGFVQRQADGSVLITPHLTPVPANDLHSDPSPPPMAASLGPQGARVIRTRTQTISGTRP